MRSDFSQSPIRPIWCRQRESNEPDKSLEEKPLAISGSYAFQRLHPRATSRHQGPAADRRSANVELTAVASQ